MVPGHHAFCVGNACDKSELRSRKRIPHGFCDTFRGVPFTGAGVTRARTKMSCPTGKLKPSRIQSLSSSVPLPRGV